MKPIEITVNYGRTINTGNYESLRLDFAIRCQLTEEEQKDTGQAFRKVLHGMRQLLEGAIKDELDHLQGQKPKRRG